LNFSEWARFERDESQMMLGLMCKEAQSGSMPMPSYTLVHRDAKLSEADVRTLCDWATLEAGRLASLPPCYISGR
jgi:hypothetical protein